jgi:geranylgeranyl reductase family protein
VTALDRSDSARGAGDRVWDVIVVGAGPAGSTAALHLAARGHAVLLLDRHRFPREKVCGDGLIPDALSALERSGVYAAVRARAHETSVVSVYSPSRIRVDLPGRFLTLRREALDAILLEGALARGAVFLQAAAAAVASANGMMEVGCSGGPGRLRARFGVVATGADTSLLAAAGVRSRSRPSGVALRCYVRSPERIEELIVSLDRPMLPGYAWIFPLGSDEYNVGCGVFYHGRRHRRTNLREAFRAFLEGFPPARRLLERAVSVTPLRGARLRCGLAGAARYDGARVLAIGETIGTTFPFTGEGIGKAMESGELAARQIDAALCSGDLGPVREFPALISRELGPRYAGYHVAETWASRAWFADLLARRVQRSPRLRQAAAGILAETVDPRTIFAWRNLLPRWLRVPVADPPGR